MLRQQCHPRNRGHARASDPLILRCQLCFLSFTRRNPEVLHIAFLSHKLPTCFLEVPGDIRHTLLWPLAWSRLGFFSPSGVRGLILGWSGWADARLGSGLIVIAESEFTRIPFHRHFFEAWLVCRGFLHAVLTYDISAAVWSDISAAVVWSR